MTALGIPAGELRVSWYLPQTECLGPGRRFALWTQGCFRRCSGCIASALQDPQGGMLISADSMADAILSAPDIEGVTVSGGEPFLQAETLGAMLHRVRTERPALGVIVYTGYCYEELLAEPAAQPLLRETDLLIDGAYVRELDDGRGMRGSSNQRLLHLTDRYRDAALPENRKTELRLKGGTMRMIGIPSEAAKEMLTLLRQGALPPARGSAP